MGSEILSVPDEELGAFASILENGLHISGRVGSLEFRRYLSDWAFQAREYLRDTAGDATEQRL